LRLPASIDAGCGNDVLHGGSFCVANHRGQRYRDFFAGLPSFAGDAQEIAGQGKRRRHGNHRVQLAGG